jgi:hypothetical protein
MIEVFDFEQGSPDWREARRGLPTASEFKTLIRTKGRGEGGESVTRKKYLYRLAAEIVTGEIVETYSNEHMDRGNDMEAEARSYYALISSEPVTRVGFLRDKEKGAGCSPDSLVGDKGLLEIKTALPDIVIAHMLKGEFPPEHKAQTQGNLWISEREWIDLEIYWPTLPRPFEKRATRDEDYIRDLAASVAQFNEELEQTVERVRRYGQPTGEVLKAQFRKSLANEPLPSLMGG